MTLTVASSEFNTKIGNGRTCACAGTRQTSSHNTNGTMRSMGALWRKKTFTWGFAEMVQTAILSGTSTAATAQRVDLDGVGLELLRLTPTGAKPTRAPLVLLHEGLGSVSMWRDWPAQLAQATGREVLLYSRRGYGRSDPIPDIRASGRRTPDYMHHEAWQVLPALLSRLGVERPVLLGHSDGGSIALLFASRHPVVATIVLAPHVMVEDLSLRSIALAREAWLGSDLRTRLARHHDDVDCAFWGWNDIWLDPAFRSFDIRRDCEAITCPVLALQGEDDAYGTAEQIVQIRPAGTIERHLLPACGHSPQRDQPELTLRRISDFLRNLP